MAKQVEVLVSELHWERLAQHPYTALVEVESRRERWPISEQDAQNLYAEISRLREEAGVARHALTPFGPLRWTLERPSEVLSVEIDGHEVFSFEDGPHRARLYPEPHPAD